MGKMEKIIREEISRLAKKEIRQFFVPIKKENTNLRRMVRHLEKKVATLSKNLPEKKRQKKVPIADVTASQSEVKSSRISPKWIRNLRKKFNISQHDLALLLDVSPAAVQSWEQGRSEPRTKNQTSLVAIRKLGRRDIKKTLKAKGPQKKTEKPTPQKKKRGPKKRGPGRPPKKRK